jgi:hypothetical protein
MNAHAISRHLPLLPLLLLGAVASSGCGNDCEGQSVPHCPFSSSLQCIDGAWQCLPNDAQVLIPIPDLSQRIAD